MTNNNRQKLILQYYPLVRQIAARVIKRLPSYIDLDDLIHIGTLGLIEAIDRFPITNTPSFKTYARMRIQGAIYDQLRQHLLAASPLPPYLRVDSVQLAVRAGAHEQDDRARPEEPPPGRLRSGGQALIPRQTQGRRNFKGLVLGCIDADFCK